MLNRISLPLCRQPWNLMWRIKFVSVNAALLKSVWIKLTSQFGIQRRKFEWQLSEHKKGTIEWRSYLRLVFPLKFIGAWVKRTFCSCVLHTPSLAPTMQSTQMIIYHLHHDIKSTRSNIVLSLPPLATWGAFINKFCNTWLLFMALFAVVGGEEKN